MGVSPLTQYILSHVLGGEMVVGDRCGSAYNGHLLDYVGHGTVAGWGRFGRCYDVISGRCNYCMSKFPLRSDLGRWLALIMLALTGVKLGVSSV